MAATIKIKNSSTASAVPTSSDLVQGELAVNVTDKRLFTENASGTVVELGTNPTSISLPAGSGSAPTLLAAGDTNTGLFFPAADTIALTTGGSERLRLDASGNLGVGTTSPSGRLDVVTASGSTYINARRNSQSTGEVGVNLYGGTSGQNWGIYIPQSSNDLRFYSNGSDRVTIDSSGNLLVGATATVNSAKFLVALSSSAAWVAMDRNTASSGTIYGHLISYANQDPNNSSNEFFYCEGNGSTQRMAVRSNGGIANYSANNVNLSDRREKTNFAPAGDYLAKICAIPVQTFNYIDQNLEEDDGLTLGVVAQDVQAVAPELVMESNWANKDQEPKMRLSIYQTDLQYALMKALQELKAEFDAYKASHP